MKCIQTTGEIDMR